MKIRVVIGTEKRTELARKVLEYSILQTTKSEIEFHSLMGEDYYDRGALGEGTGFSLLRFSVPELFNYAGRAIYLDADMVVLSDIKELWNLDSENIVHCAYGNEYKEKAETSVMIFNCEKAKGKIKSLAEIKEYLKDDINREKYREIMKLSYLEPKPKQISRFWNVMDKGNIYTSIKDFNNPKAKLLHYTNVRTQPWFAPNHPHRNIWEKWLRKALKDGYVSGKEIKALTKKYDHSNPRRPNGLHPYWLKVLR